MQRRPEAGEELAASIPADLPADERAALASLVLNQFRHRLDFEGYLVAAEQLGEDERPEIRFWAEAPEPEAVIPSNVIELDYADRKIEGAIGGEPVTIVFDTGAPGVGVDYGIAEREGYPIFTDFESYSVLPAFGIRAKQDATVISELRLGEAVLRNIPATTSKNTEEDRAKLERAGLASDLIFGLDIFAPFFAAVEIDQVEGKLRLYRDAPPQPLSGRFLMGTSRYPLTRIAIGGRERNVILDTGSGNNSLPPEWLENVPCGDTRIFKRSWGSFSEQRVPVTLGGETLDLWVTPRGFGKDEWFNSNGVLGVVNRGRMVFDLRNGKFGLLDYDPATAVYDFPVESTGSNCASPG